MTKLSTLESYLNKEFPPVLAEDWDNVGILVGDKQAGVGKVMTCLTISPDVVDEAIEKKVDLIISHHPFPFRPLKKITNHNLVGNMLLRLIQNRVHIYSPHTAYDSAQQGINQQIANSLKLKNVKPLEYKDDFKLGSGRYGQLSKAVAMKTVMKSLTKVFKTSNFNYVGNLDNKISRVAIACGAAGQFLGLAQKYNCDLFITGETNFHTCLEARSNQINLILPGHYATERFALETLSEKLQKKFPKLTVWASKVESDPIQWHISN